MVKTASLRVTPTQRGELRSYLRKRNLPASVAQRIRIVLLLDEGCSYSEIEEQLRVPPSTISRWKRRFQQDGLVGLATIHPGQPPSKLTPALRARLAGSLNANPQEIESFFRTAQTKYAKRYETFRGAP